MQNTIKEIAYRLQYSVIQLNTNGIRKVSRRHFNEMRWDDAGMTTGESGINSGKMITRSAGIRYRISPRHAAWNKTMKGYQRDAYDISIDKVLEIHSGGATHDRVTSYVECDVIRKPRHLAQTADKCVTLNTTVDPYQPPSVESPLYKNNKSIRI